MSRLEPWRIWWKGVPPQDRLIVGVWLLAWPCTCGAWWWVGDGLWTWSRAPGMSRLGTLGLAVSLGTLTAGVGAILLEVVQAWRIRKPRRTRPR